MTSSSAPAGSIVVGIDGSPGSHLALDWAAHQASLEQRPLTLAHSAHLSVGGDALGFLRTGSDLSERTTAAGDALLDTADRRAHELAPGLTVHRILRTDVDARQLLTELSAQSASLVVGSRGRGALVTALLGSVSVGLTKHATCPVTVVRREPGSGGGGVMVEVGDGEAGAAALDHAYRAAALRGWAVTAIRPVWVPGHLGARPGDVGPDVPGLDRERTQTAEAVAAVAAAYPDLTARVRLLSGVREHVLVVASQDADLLVLGSRRHGSLDDLLQGSAVSTVVEHARCDVTVVPTGH